MACPTIEVLVLRSTLAMLVIGAVVALCARGNILTGMQFDNVTIVICSTKEPGSDYHLNLCKGLKWDGFQTKIRSVGSYAASRPRTELICVIDSDVFVNPSLVAKLAELYKGFSADIVLSSEEFCWIGHDCLPKEARSLYPEWARSGWAPFVNGGGIIGRAGAIAGAIALMPDRVTDDQYAWTLLYATIKHSYKIAVDSRQSIFGTVTRAKEVGFDWNPFERRGTCLRHGNFKWRGCAYAPRALQSDSSCNVFGRNFPVFWHGNGGLGKSVWRQWQVRRLQCLRELKHNFTA